MSAWAAKPARQATVYVAPVSVEVTSRDGNGLPTGFRVESVPALHHATVRQRGYHGSWEVCISTLMTSRSYKWDTQAQALQCARDLVGRKAGADFKATSAAQRYAMGQQQCPRLMSGTVCGEPADVGTVWCRWHPGGKEAAR